jgi:O-6-methylguanine DNA methyltransferase
MRAEADETNVLALEFDRTEQVGESNKVLETLRRELNEYFAGDRTSFSVSLEPEGTDFRKRVWAELQRIPHSETISYEELAVRIGKPTATRAVAQANGANPICVLIPCHRVIGKDGRLTGYSAGLERKRFLLGLEQGEAVDTADFHLQVEQCSC